MQEEKIDIYNVFKLQPARPVTYFGVGALDKIDEILVAFKSEGIDKVIVITDSTVYKVTGAWDKVKPALEKHGISYVVWEGLRPNSTYAGCDKVAHVAILTNSATN